MITPTTFKHEANHEDQFPEFFLCQYMPDVLRKETKNVGVVVKWGDRVESRFIGESDEEINGRGLNWIQDLGAYKEWVRFWKKTTKGDSELLEKKLISSGKRNYFVVPGGYVGEVEESADLSTVCSLLFSTLVAGGLDQFFKENEGINAEARSFDLKRIVAKRFRDAGIFGPSSGLSAPVLENQYVAGAKIHHRFCFAQSSLTLTRPIELINVRRGLVDQIMHHAGYAANAFFDVSKGKVTKELDPVSIVILDDSKERKELSEYCVKVLSGVSRIVNWGNEREQESLINDCRRTAGLLPI